MRRWIDRIMAICMFILATTLYACGNNAYSSDTVFASYGPALTVVNADERNEEPKTVAVPSKDDELSALSLAEVESYRLFEAVLNESDYQSMLEQDAVPFIPDCAAISEDETIAYCQRGGKIIVIFNPRNQGFIYTYLQEDSHETIEDITWDSNETIWYVVKGDNNEIVYSFNRFSEETELLKIVECQNATVSFVTQGAKRGILFSKIIENADRTTFTDISFISIH